MSTECGSAPGEAIGSTFAPFPNLWGFSVFRTSTLHREWLTIALMAVTAARSSVPDALGVARPDADPPQSPQAPSAVLAAAKPPSPIDSTAASTILVISSSLVRRDPSADAEA